MMETTQIVKQAQQMETMEDLLALLNLIKQDEAEKGGTANKFHPFTIRQLNYYCNPNHTTPRYKQFSIKKKSGGEHLITAPHNRSFKMLLHCVNTLFQAMYTPPCANAMGFTKGRSVVTNARVHVGQNYVFNIDLKDFFPSIEQARVWKRLQLKPFNFPIQIASILAGLCAMKVVDENDEVHYVLPQGAPTSPIITNMICDILDRRLTGLAKRFNLHYSRYADDITFSSMHNVYQEGGDFQKELLRIITDQGFTLNQNKTRLQKRGARQEVTGIIVNDKVNVTKDYARSLRNVLYIWERYGIEIASNTFNLRYREEKGHVKKNVPDIVLVIRGKLNYLRMVKGEDDPVYNRLSIKFQQLQTGPLMQDTVVSPIKDVDVDKLLTDIDGLLND